jgi:alpha-1,6-mannosyltransferase
VVLVSHERLDAVIGHVSRLGPRLSPIVRCYDRRVVRHVDRIVCASRFAACEFDGIAGPPIEHIPLGVDLGAFRPRIGPRRPGPLRLVSVVRLSPEKSPHLLVETSRALVARGVAHEYLVLGDGPHRQRLEAAARGLPITFAGHCADRSTVAAAMNDADIGIAPGPNETFGLAALELLASGTPVVVPAHGALPEVISAGVGVVAEMSSVAFADAVISSAAALDDRVRFAARRRAEQFAWAVSVDSFLGLFERLTDRTAEEGAGRQPDASAVGRSYL